MPDDRYDFDERIDRRHSDSTKWRLFDADVLPLWTADMDYRVAEPIVRALSERVAHGVFGYAIEPPELRETIAERLASVYGWHVGPEAIVFQTGVVSGLDRLCQVVASPGDAVVVMPPVYAPIATIARRNNCQSRPVPLVRAADGGYAMDLERLEDCLTDRPAMLVLCNPHNPVGRVFSAVELSHLAEVCLRKNVLLCSDEIHCDLVFSGQSHVPVASLSPEIESRTVTFMAPSKTFNLPGLRCSFAVVPDPSLRARIAGSHSGLFADVNVFGFVAAAAAYREGQSWLRQVLEYLEGNRDLVVDHVRREMPGVRVRAPEGTYLAWLDCRDSAAGDNPFELFLERARVGLADGRQFGAGGEGFVRLNFACTRATLKQALSRMSAALE